MYYEEKKMETEKDTAVFYSITYYHKILKDEPYGPDTHICESGVIIRLFHFIFVYLVNKSIPLPPFLRQESQRQQ